MGEARDPDPAAFGLTIEWCKPIREHARQVLEWRNDPQTLAMFYHRTPKEDGPFWIEFQRDYFKTLDQAPPFFTLIDEERAAFLRFNEAGHPEGLNRVCYDISINVNPAVRGKGVGAKSLCYAAELLKSRGVDDIVAEIRVENAASVKSFEKAGFELLKRAKKHIEDTGETCDIFVYLRRLT